MTERIQLARVDDLPRPQEVERAGGVVFREIGMDSVADDEPPALGVLACYQLRGCCWVATDPADEPVGYLLADLAGGAAHIEQVSVHPNWASRRIGQRLLETVSGWALSQGLGSLTLTTFSQVPWNGPYYERLGFRVVEERNLSAGLRRIRADEMTRGLDRWPRVVMRRELRQPARRVDAQPATPIEGPT